MTEGTRKRTAQDRFWPKVNADQSGGCWRWIGAIDGSTGYGNFWDGQFYVILEPVTRRTNVLRGAGIPARNAAKTHCAQAHEYTPENTYRPPGGNTRQCRICRAAADRRRRRVTTKGIA